MIEERFQDLLETYVDRSLSDAESSELLDAFAEDSTTKSRFVEELKLSHSLAGLSLLDDTNKIPTDVIESIRNGKDAPDISASVLSELRSTSKTIASFPFAKIAIGIAAVIAVTLLVLLPTQAPIAVVANLVDAEWSDTSSFSVGAKIGKGRLHLAAGIARLDFANGVRVTLEGPADFELIGHGETRLHSGILTAHVPPAGVGFLVHTERAKVVDLGTTFGVSVGKDGVTDVAVFEGEVEVTSIASREEKIIHEGNVVTLSEASKNLTPKKLKTRSFRGWPVLFGVVNTGGQVRFVNAQPIRNPGDVTDAENIIVFPERFGAKLKSDLKVTITETGIYRPKDLVNGEEILTANERRVDSYLLQYNPPFVEGIPNSEQKRFLGHVTFDRPIIAVIADRDQLRESDTLLGKSRFDYSTEGSRGLEHGDFLTLSEDRRTLKIDWLVMQALKRGKDQIRVIVDASDIK